ncbi:peptidoglycan DD-metalloendopeptidase family protein [Halodesulfovibrio aestuarii]|uniref:Murein DD-endopeptidase MepM and murein hydrolase activator NlpD, contain LysM domain n=1 Tax=Halodesulfovibrio aestuarii TaxID=126333 RepID=A0A8G2CBI5_9BACT|nr:peptidoglycan DD-metalloendopeptidase family protein [Halodesulfovibrio aestuarii]SHJ56824.1 Murein DD-endopeptidase MepM and murein hydrolase activator NlpD, contain LysM domain [Halodesulfovibrio aestuarii]
MVAPIDSELLNASIGAQQLKAKTNQLSALKKGGKAGDAKLRKAVEGFEAIFIQKMWQQMRNTIPKSGMFKSREEKMWQGMFDQELSVKMSQSGGIGLSDMLYKQLAEKLGDASRDTSSKGGDAAPVRDLSSPDVFTKVKALSPRVAAAVPPPEDLYSPMEEQELETDTTATRVINTNLQVMTDKDVVENVNELERQLEMKFIADPQQILKEQATSGSVDQAMAEPVQKAQKVAVEEELVSPETIDASTEASEIIGMGGPIAPSPDMATINWPLPGSISSKFGWRKDPFTGKKAWHSGVDIAGKTGESVAAAWDGKVIYSGEKKGYGKLVVLEHPNGWRSYYGHNSKLNVEVGETIAAGKKIAEVGSTGRSTGPHLHFEVRQGELAWNPQQIRSRLMAGLPIGRVT